MASFKKEDLGKYVAQRSWWIVLEIYREIPDSQEVKISKSGDTALHVAISSNFYVFQVEQLVKVTGGNALAIGNELGDTPLHVAANLGSASICRCIAERDYSLIGLRNKMGETPLFVAVSKGRMDAFLCLLEICESFDEGHKYIYHGRNNGDTVLHSTISEQHFDIAYHIIRNYTELVHKANEAGLTPFHILASNPSAFQSGTHLVGLSKLVYHCISVDKLSDIEKVPNPKRQPGQETVLMLPYGIALYFGMESVLQQVDDFVLDLHRVCCGKNQQRNEAAANEQVDRQEDHPHDEEAVTEQVDHRENHQRGETATSEQELKDCMRCTALAAAGRRVLQSASVEILLRVMCACLYYIWRIIILVVFPLILVVFLLIWAVSSCVKFIIGYEHYASLRQVKERCTWSAQVMSELLGRMNYDQEQQGMSPDHTSPTAATKKETALLIAAKHGVVEMVDGILNAHADAIFHLNDEGKNILMLAVEYRQTHLYEFLLKDGRIMNNIYGQVDKHKNSVLHIAAKLEEGQRPWPIQGAALQMHMEVKWYNFVKHSMAPYAFFSHDNHGDQTPEKIFEDTHKELQNEGRQWLTNNAQSCSVVATLIATIAFATSASFPGGFKQDSGIPALEKEPVFIISAISSLIALCSSMISVVMFLGILTSNFQLNDFLKDLPFKHLAGMISLLVSIVSMLISFFAGHHFVLKQELQHTSLPLYIVLCLSLLAFIIAKFPLDFEILRITLKKKPEKSAKSLFFST